MLVSMGATEDDVWRRLLAGQRPADVAGQATHYGSSRTRKSTQSALKPSRQVIFLPSSYVRP